MLNKPIYIRLLILLSAVLLIFMSDGIASPLSWQKITLDADGDVGRYCDISIDSSGNLYVVYLREDDGTLKTISSSGGSWVPPAIIDASGDVDGHCSIAVEENGTERISYRMRSTGTLWYAGPERSPDWSTMIIDEIGDVGTYCDLGLDSLGNLHAVYCDNNDANLKLITSVSNVWQPPEIVDSSSAVAGHCGMAVQPNGSEEISYRKLDTGALWYAGSESLPDWYVKTVYKTPSNAGLFTSLAIGPDGRLGSAFYAFDDYGHKDIRVLVISGDTIGSVRSAITEVASQSDDAIHMDLAISNDGQWYISYRNSIETALYCAVAHDVVTGIFDGNDDKGPPEPGNYVFELNQNVPNPFNPTTSIAYSIPKDGWVSLKIYNVAGHLIKTLVDEWQCSGTHKIIWEGRDNRSVNVASGIYFVVLRTSKHTQTRKLVLLR